MSPGNAVSPGDPGRPAVRRLVFAGEAIVDLVMRVPALPERGGDMLASSSATAVGGGFNIMAAAARQGLPVLYAGGHGTGPWGDLARAAGELDPPRFRGLRRTMLILTLYGIAVTAASAYFFQAPWMMLIPGLAIALVAIGFNLLGDGLRDALNPRMHTS